MSNPIHKFIIGGPKEPPEAPGELKAKVAGREWEDGAEEDITLLRKTGRHGDTHIYEGVENGQAVEVRYTPRTRGGSIRRHR